MTASEYLDSFKRTFEEHADANDAAAMKKYMRDQFEFYGIKTPLRKQLVKDILRQHGIPGQDTFHKLSRLCFETAENREIQYLVNDLGRKLIKKEASSYLVVIENLIPRKSWWDTIDFLSPKLAGPLFLKYPQQIDLFAERWIRCDNFWFQRAAILYQLDYKEKTDEERLFDYILRRADSKEFFVQKAAGWVLRNYSKVNPQGVRKFVEDNPHLPKLTVREGTKALP